jgi:hypothetical protein
LEKFLLEEDACRGCGFGGKLEAGREPFDMFETSDMMLVLLDTDVRPSRDLYILFKAILFGKGACWFSLLLFFVELIFFVFDDVEDGEALVCVFNILQSAVFALSLSLLLLLLLFLLLNKPIGLDVESVMLLQTLLVFVTLKVFDSVESSELHDGCRTELAHEVGVVDDVDEAVACFLRDMGVGFLMIDIVLMEVLVTFVIEIAGVASFSFDSVSALRLFAAIFLPASCPLVTLSVLSFLLARLFVKLVVIAVEILEPLRALVMFVELTGVDC